VLTAFNCCCAHAVDGDVGVAARVRCHFELTTRLHALPLPASQPTVIAAGHVQFFELLMNLSNGRNKTAEKPARTKRN